MDEELLENPTQTPSDQEPLIVILDNDGENRRVCGENKKDGTPCTCPPLRNKTYCIAHDPTRVGERKRNAQIMAKAREGRKLLKDASFLPAQLNGSEDLLSTVHGILHNLFVGKMEPKVATAGFYGINAACRIHKDNQKGDVKAKLTLKFGATGAVPVSGTIEGPIEKIQELTG